MEFNPNTTSRKDAGLFGLPFSEDEASLVLIPVPWEVTTSFGHGTSLGPQAILKSSDQLDLCDPLYGEFYKMGLFQRPVKHEWLSRSQLLKEKALAIRDKLEGGEELEEEDHLAYTEINQSSQELNQWLYQESKALLDQNKWVGVIGGDHSSPYGLIKALKEKHSDLSVLHIDAHMDLRQAYQGYDHSHASIMYNVMQDLKPTSLVQLGIRDFCPEEKQRAESDDNIFYYTDSHIQLRLAGGESWQNLISQAFSNLSDTVYISMDIDGLTPDLCPHTGTPVPGGLSFSQVETMLYWLSQSGKKIVGFDLCEVAPESSYDLEGWDGNVGARVLFKMCGALLTNQAF